MAMIVDPTNVSPENVKAALLEFLLAQPNAEAWKPFYQSSTGALIIYIAAGMGALHQYNVIVNRRESYLFYAENRSSCVAIDNTLGYSAFRGSNVRLRLYFIPNQTASVAKLSVLGTYKSYDILAADAFSMTAGTPAVIEVILGEVYTESINIASSDLQVFRFESEKVSDDLILSLDSTILPLLSENLKDLVDDYYVILSNAYGAIDALYLNEGPHQYGYGNTLTLSYVELVDVGYGTGDDTKLILTIGGITATKLLSNYLGPESKESLKIRGPLYHEINSVIKSRDDFKNAMLLIIPGAVSTNGYDVSPATVALTYVRSDLTLLTPAEKVTALAEIDNYRPFGIYMPTLSDPTQLNITLDVVLTLDPNVGAVGSTTIATDIATIMAQYEKVLEQTVDLEEIEEDIEELSYMRIARITTTDSLVAAWDEYFIIATNISIAGVSSSSTSSSSSSISSSSISSSSISSSSISSSSSSSSSSISSSSSSISSSSISSSSISSISSSSSSISSSSSSSSISSSSSSSSISSSSSSISSSSISSSSISSSSISSSSSSSSISSSSSSSSISSSSSSISSSSISSSSISSSSSSSSISSSSSSSSISSSSSSSSISSSSSSSSISSSSSSSSISSSSSSSSISSSSSSSSISSSSSSSSISSISSSSA